MLSHQCGMYIGMRSKFPFPPPGGARRPPNTGSSTSASRILDQSHNWVRFPKVGNLYTCFFSPGGHSAAPRIEQLSKSAAAVQSSRCCIPKSFPSCVWRHCQAAAAALCPRTHHTVLSRLSVGLSAQGGLWSLGFATWVSHRSKWPPSTPSHDSDCSSHQTSLKHPPPPLTTISILSRVHVPPHTHLGRLFHPSLTNFRKGNALALIGFCASGSGEPV